MSTRTVAPTRRKWTAKELRKLSPVKRHAILLAATKLAERDYCGDPDLSAFEAFDAFQTKSISVARFVRKLGAVPSAQVDAVASAIALCVGAS